jgi:Xaa-Pro aminopeptidase
MRSEDVLQAFPMKIYKKRRQLLAKKLYRQGGDFVALFWSGLEYLRTATVHFPFRANSDFLYLVGLNEPDTLLMIEVKDGKYRDQLGLRPRDLSANRGSEIWEGERVGVERAPKILGVASAFDIHQWKSVVHEKMLQHERLFWRLGFFPGVDQFIQSNITQWKDLRKGIRGTRAIEDPSIELHEMRKFKSSEEVKIMRRSAEIAAIGHIRAMQSIRPGLFEYQIAAETEREFKRHGAASTAYNSIVASGNNACTLHYHANNQLIQDGDLMLMDAGAEYKGYASDITRCFPASGRFSEAQREVYSWVLRAQKAAISAARSGRSFHAPHEAALRVLAQALREMKIIKKPVTQIIEKRLYSRYFPHGTSHWIGMDVHDCGVYFDKKGKSVPLKPGNVLTIEPGLYFRRDDKTVAAKYRGIGVRIEDDVLITSRGPDVLTRSCPKEIREIESLRLPRL